MLNIDIKVGCKGITNTHWEKSFFPDDLPNDWKLDYYANEFSTILLNSRDDKNYLEEIDDSLNKDFHLIIDNSSNINQKTTNKEIILNHTDSVIIKQVCNFNQLISFDSLYKAQTNNKNSVYSYQLNALLKPIELKDLVTFCINDGCTEDNCIEEKLSSKQKNKIIYLFFGNNKYAIENTRNMNILIQML